MRASEQQGIDPFFDQRLEVCLQNLPRRRVRKPVFLDQRNQQGRSLAVDHQPSAALSQRVLIRMGTDRPASRDDANSNRVGTSQRGFHAGFDHPEDRHAVLFKQARQGVGGGRVAGHDDGFYPAGNEELHVLIGKLADGFRAFRAIRQACGIAEIQNVFGGQQLLDGAHDGEATNARIENP